MDINEEHVQILMVKFAELLNAKKKKIRELICLLKMYEERGVAVDKEASIMVKGAPTSRTEGPSRVVAVEDSDTDDEKPVRRIVSPKWR